MEEPSVDIKEIKQIVDIVKRAELTEFELEQEGLRLRISRANGDAAASSMPLYGGSMPPFPMPPAAPAAPAAAAEAPAPEPTGRLIKSPMVGTFYAAPSPDAPPFVKTGDTVNDEAVVCIIEAMKVMNEIKAEISGKISEVLVQNGDSVEFGQPLFRVE